jgi:hypothetical protein
VRTGGAYVKGGEVTRDNYQAYRRARKAGTAGAQGVGPCQLTYSPFQDQADAAGGCWDWRANVLTGFTILAGLIRHAGERDGFRRYNGSGPAAERYADDAVARLARWRALLADTTTSSPAPQEVDMPLTTQEIQAIADAVWRRPTANGWGDVVGAEQILAGTEVRVVDVQDQVHRTPAAGLSAPGASISRRWRMRSWTGSRSAWAASETLAAGSSHSHCPDGRSDRPTRLTARAGRECSGRAGPPIVTPRRTRRLTTDTPPGLTHHAVSV